MFKEKRRKKYNVDKKIIYVINNNTNVDMSNESNNEKYN